jgi:translin
LRFALCASREDEVMTLEDLGQKIRGALDEKNRVREEMLGLSREIIRTAANTIRAVHRDEFERAAEMLQGATDRVARLRRHRESFAEIYNAGYVHDCQKEYAEAAVFLALVAGRSIPDPDDLQVEYAAYLNGMGEAVGELRRHTLDEMRRGHMEQAEALLASMDEIYYLLVTFDYPDALTGGLRRTTDSVRGIIEKTRGELTMALRLHEVRAVLDQSLQALRPPGNPHDG